MEIGVKRQILDCDQANKSIYLNNYSYDEYEIEKSISLMSRLEKYIESVSGNKPAKNFYYSPEGSIQFINSLGYVSFINTDRDNWSIYYYGSFEEEAFMNAVIDYEMSQGRDFEFKNRLKLNKEYLERFPDDISDYHGPFFFAEHSLQGLRKFYKDDIPEVMIRAFEEYLKQVEGETFLYDYPENRLVKKGKKEEWRNLF